MFRSIVISKWNIELLGSSLGLCFLCLIDKALLSYYKTYLKIVALFFFVYLLIRLSHNISFVLPARLEGLLLYHIKLWVLFDIKLWADTSS